MPAPTTRRDPASLQGVATSQVARIEVCPPRGWQRSLPLWHGKLKAYWAALRGRPLASSRSQHLLAEAKLDFADALTGVYTIAAEVLMARIGQARSLRELWHLRAELFNLLSLRYGQHDAQERVLPLNRHFPTRAAGSGFGTLDSGRVANW